MGCTTSTETGEPSKTSNKRNFQQTMRNISHQELNALDQARIDLILDYWYDEGPQDGSGGNSHNYPERMMRIRKGNLEEEIIDDAHTAEMPVI